MSKKIKLISILLVVFEMYGLWFIISKKNNNYVDNKKIVEEYIYGDEYFHGDVNGNNKLDAQDYKYVVRYLLGIMNLNDNQSRAADANGDGKISAVDYKTIVRKILSGDTNPPINSDESVCYYKDADSWQYIWTNNPPNGYSKVNVSKSDCVNACYCDNSSDKCGVYAKKSWSGWTYVSDTTDKTECENFSSGSSIFKGYDITKDSKYDGYIEKASCSSSTMNLRIIQKNGNYYSLIWVRNPAYQFGVGLADSNAHGTASASSILNGEIGNGCAVAVNGSLFSGGTITGGVVIKNGKIVKDSGNSQGLIGMNSSGYLGEYSHQTATSILNSGVINTVGISSTAHVDNSSNNTGRTQICQVDANNFAIYSGSGTVAGCGAEVSNFTGCSTVYNLDGGGSRKLYYQTKSSGLTKIIDGGRQIFDMVYFTE